jgi:phosphoribosylaminoimidazole-succinocarboxamide synthase
MDGIAEAYQEVARRLGILPESSPVDIKGPRIIQ